MLIDCSYFTKGTRHILNASLGCAEGSIPNPNAAEVCGAIIGYIEEHQEQYLRGMLGASLGNKVNAYLVCQDEDENPPIKENIDAVVERLRDSFADYVFFHIVRDSNEQQTMTGLVRLKCANTYVSPMSRQVNVWNAMVDKNRAFAEWAASDDCPLKGIGISSEMTTKINRLNL